MDSDSIRPCLDVVVFTSIHVCWCGLEWNLVQIPLQFISTYVDWCKSDYIQTRLFFSSSVSHRTSTWDCISSEFCPCEAAPISIHYLPPSWYLVRAILPPSWYLSCCIHRWLHARYGAGIGSEAWFSFLWIFSTDDDLISASEYYIGVILLIKVYTYTPFSQKCIYI